MKNSELDRENKKQIWLGEVHQGGEGPNWTVVLFRKKKKKKKKKKKEKKKKKKKEKKKRRKKKKRLDALSHAVGLIEVAAIW